jgi:hypothetical protein
MATVGRKQLTFQERKKLFRKTPRIIRPYASELVTKYQSLLDSYTCEDYQLYEKLLHKFKRTDAMAMYCKTNQVSNPILELALLREADKKTHQKLIQVLRHKWTNKWEADTISVNNNEDKFWYRMAASIQRRAKDRNIELYREWHGLAGRDVLIAFLKKQYAKQKGLCGLTNQPMLLEIGIREKNEQKCSPDRKNSNLGYLPNNLWFVVWWANAMKMDMSINIFRDRIRILSENI